MRVSRPSLRLALLGLMLLQPSDTGADERPLDIAVSIAPLSQLVARLGGSEVRITVLAPAGAAPETWSPTPREALALARADLYLSVGHPGLLFESRQLESIAEQVDIGGRLSMVGGEKRRVDEDDPHLWMDLELLASTAERVAEWLISRRPGKAAGIERGLERYLEDVRQVDAVLGTLLSARAERPLLFQHPAWERLLDRYGVESLSIEIDGKEPPPARLAHLIELARALDVPAVFTQIGVSDRGARLLAAEIGAELVALDPTAGEWLENLRSVGESFAGAMR